MRFRLVNDAISHRGIDSLGNRHRQSVVVESASPGVLIEGPEDLAGGFRDGAADPVVEDGFGIGEMMQDLSARFLLSSDSGRSKRVRARSFVSSRCSSFTNHASERACG